jgi:sugar-specific transcriptional regulator TrmB
LEVQEENTQTLMELGLTFCQAKVYLALVPNGSCTAKIISRLSKVTRQDVYRIMPQLQKLGLVQKVLRIPIEWEAIPIDEGLAILLERKNKQFSELQKKTTKILSNFRESNKRTEHKKEEPEFVIIPEGETHRNWIMKKIGEAKMSNDIFITMELFKCVLFNETKRMKKLMERGVKFRHIVYNLDGTKDEIELDPYLKKNPKFQVRYLLNTPLAATVSFDKKEVVFSNPTDNLCTGSKLWSNNPHFVKLIQNYFETTWKTARQNLNQEITERQ